MHLAQAKMRLPAKALYFFRVVPSGTVRNCRFGYLLFLGVGLYLPLSLFSFPAIIEPLPQIAHCFAILEIVSE